MSVNSVLLSQPELCSLRQLPPDPPSIPLPAVFFALAATALLVIVSVSVPIWNSVRFLEATLDGQQLIMGNWGYCLGSTCTSSKLGYGLQSTVQNLLDAKCTCPLDLAFPLLQGTDLGFVLRKSDNGAVLENVRSAHRTSRLLHTSDLLSIPSFLSSLLSRSS